MHRKLAIAVLAIVLCASQVPAHARPSDGSGPSTADRAAAAAPGKNRTEFALSALAFGTRAQGGDVPVESDRTGFQVIGCTNVVGKVRRNFAAEATIPGVGVAEGVTSRVWTVRKGTTVSSYATHDIAKLTLLETPLGSLSLRGLSSMSRAYHEAGRFRTEVTNEIGSVVLKPTGLPPQTLPLPSPGQPLVVPGLARIESGKTSRTANRRLARAATNVLDVTILPTGTRVRVAQTNAKIAAGVARGVFQGFAAGMEARALDDNLKSGRVPLLVMPCQGTDGEVETNSTAEIDLGGQILVSGVDTRQRSVNRPEVARGTEVGEVAEVSLAGGQLVIRAIRGVANVTRAKGGVTRDIRGTSVGSIVANGETMSLPATGPLEIPGLATIEDAVTTRRPNGLKVVALRVTLLDGTGAVIDLGIASLSISPGARRR